MAGYRDLRVWKSGMRIAESVYVLTREFPSHELYGLTTQLRRAAVSVPSNIAEGHGRGAPAEFARYLSIARGSLCELETQLELACRFKYLTPKSLEALQTEIAVLMPQLTALRNAATREPTRRSRPTTDQ